MNSNVVVDKINNILMHAGYRDMFNSISEVEHYLANESNIGQSIYEVIEQLYTQLMEDIDI